MRSIITDWRTEGLSDINSELLFKVSGSLRGIALRWVSARSTALALSFSLRSPSLSPLSHITSSTCCYSTLSMEIWWIFIYNKDTSVPLTAWRQISVQTADWIRTWPAECWLLHHWVELLLILRETHYLNLPQSTSREISPCKTAQSEKLLCINMANILIKETGLKIWRNWGERSSCQKFSV